MRFVEIEDVLHIGAAPGVDRLVGIADDEEVAVMRAEHLHQLVLKRVDVLELVDHDVFQTTLPLEADGFIAGEDAQHEDDEVVVVKRERLLFLIQIAVKDDVVDALGRVVLGAQSIERHRDEIVGVIGLFEQLLDFDHVPRVGKSLVAQRQSALLVDQAQHRVDVAVVEDDETFGILHGVAVLAQHGDAEAVEGVDERGIVVADEVADARAHLPRRLVGERHAEDILRQDAQFVDKERAAVRERPRLAGAGPGDDAHKAFRRHDGFALLVVQFIQDHGPGLLSCCFSQTRFTPLSCLQARQKLCPAR